MALYRILPRTFVITVLVVLGAALLALLMSITEWATGQAIEWWKVPRTINTVVLTVVLIVGVGAKFLWRPLWRLVPGLNRWVFPDLNGTWEGELHTTWVDPETGKGSGPIKAVVTIAVDWFDASIRMQTDKMQSFSNRVFLEREKGTNVFRVWYGYQHKPTAASQPGNPPHDGMAYLEFDTANPSTLRGQYYTSRHTSGDFELEHASPG